MILMWLACADTPKDTATEAGINVSGQVVALFGGTGIPEAPQDGNYYVRQNQTWVLLTDALTALNVAWS